MTPETEATVAALRKVALRIDEYLKEDKLTCTLEDCQCSECGLIHQVRLDIAITIDKLETA